MKLEDDDDDVDDDDSISFVKRGVRYIQSVVGLNETKLKTRYKTRKFISRGKQANVLISIKIN